jgi:hypothetical protein
MQMIEKTPRMIRTACSAEAGCAGLVETDRDGVLAGTIYMVLVANSIVIPDVS